MRLQRGFVLVIEDEHDSMELVQEVLAYHGVQSIGAGTAEAALHELEQQTPILILIDLALPQMDGWTLMNHLHDIPHLAQVPKVAMTAFHTPSLANQALESGFDAYFPKPIDATTFVRELEGLLEDLAE